MDESQDKYTDEAGNNILQTGIIKLFFPQRQ